MGIPSLLFKEYGGVFPGVKQPGREADHSLPSSAKARNDWSYTAIPTTCLHGVAGNMGLLGPA